MKFIGEIHVTESLFDCTCEGGKIVVSGGGSLRDSCYPTTQD